MRLTTTTTTTTITTVDFATAENDSGSRNDETSEKDAAGENKIVHAKYWPMDLVAEDDAPIACLSLGYWKTPNSGLSVVNLTSTMIGYNYVWVRLAAFETDLWHHCYGYSAQVRTSVDRALQWVWQPQVKLRLHPCKVCSPWELDFESSNCSPSGAVAQQSKTRRGEYQGERLQWTLRHTGMDVILPNPEGITRCRFETTTLRATAKLSALKHGNGYSPHFVSQD